MNTCSWCNKDATIIMFTKYAPYSVEPGIEHPDIIIWKRHLNDERIYACEEHRSDLENITREEMDKRSIKDPNPMSLEQWLKTSDWFNGEDEDEDE